MEHSSVPGSEGMSDRGVPTDAALLVEAEHDAHAFRLFYDRYAEAILRYFSRRGADHHTALDLTAETFAGSWLSRERFCDPGDGNAGPWLFGIARNVLSHWLRHDAVVTRSRERLGMLADRPQPDPVAAAAIDSIHGDADLEDALAALPAPSRHAVELRVVNGSTYDEIGHALGCSPLAARIRVSRALAELRGDLITSEGANDER